MHVSRLYLPAAIFLLVGSGSTISRARADEAVTFTEHVAPIVFNNCTSCHRPGEGTPFTLMNYHDVKKRAKLIREVSHSGYMPPWPPAAGWGHFQDERRLSKDQLDSIAKWVDGGMAEGPAEKLPPLPKFAEGGWVLGTPDLVVTLPEAFTVPADGPDIYRMFVLPLGLDKDKWVTAVEIRPTAKSVVHHALFFLDDTGMSRKLDEETPGQGFSRMGFPRTGTLGGWAVGATPRHLPMNLAYSLPKAADLVVQMHFHPSGKEEQEKTSFGLYFAKKPPEKKLLGTQSPKAFGFMTDLRTKGISPGEKDFTIRGEWKVPFDVDVVAVGGHAHYLCKTMKAVATLPDGKEQKLFAIDDWDFNWQGRYNYAEPVRLPKGTVVRTTLVYDNSSDNPRNPTDPPVHVKWGEGSEDEMGAIGFAFVAVDEKDASSFRGMGMFGGGDQVGRITGPGAITRNGFGGGGGGGTVTNLTPEQLRKLLQVRDANKNGKLEGDEIPQRLQPLLGLVDANDDGGIDNDELTQTIDLILRGKGDARPGSKENADPPKNAKRKNDPPVTDLGGKSWHPLQPADGTKAHVLLFVTNDCPVSNQYAQEMSRLAREYAEKHVQFLLVQVDPATSAADAQEHAKEFGLTLPILLDPDHRLVDRTGAKVTPEAAVITADGAIAYCGRIDDRFGKLGRQRPEPSKTELRDALDAVLAGKPVANARVDAIGCPIADLKS